MLRILHLSPEHYTNTLKLLTEWHRRQGHYARYVTFYDSHKGYPEDICLNLPFCGYSILTRWLIKKFRHEEYYLKNSDCLRFWKPRNVFFSFLFKLREQLWRVRLLFFFGRFPFFSFDIYFFHAGVEFFRDGRTLRKLKERKKILVTFYHGTDVRNRGIIESVESQSDLSLTCELDHLQLYPKLKYVFLPVDHFRFVEKKFENRTLVLGHAPTKRHFKGSDFIIKVCEELVLEKGIVFLLIENKPYTEALSLKQNCDIFIDQVGDRGGWGYGMNALESLSMGIITCTYLNPTYAAFIPDHPFVNVNEDSLKDQLTRLIDQPQLRKKYQARSRPWVEQYHGVSNVLNKIYQLLNIS